MIVLCQEVVKYKKENMCGNKIFFSDVQVIFIGNFVGKYFRLNLQGHFRLNLQSHFRLNLQGHFRLSLQSH